MRNYNIVPVISHCAKRVLSEEVVLFSDIEHDHFRSSLTYI